MKEYQKKYRKNNILTDDKKTKNERISKTIQKNMTDDQKRKMKEYKKK